MKYPCVYILASYKKGTLYVGVTSNLLQRIYQHKNHLIEGFTDNHSVTQLVYYEFHDGMSEAIEREKKIKEWKRQWKIELIEKMNPYWNDLYGEIIESYPYQ